MEDDGFTLVTGRKAGKLADRKFEKTENGTHIRVDGTIEEIDKSMSSATCSIQKSGLSTWLREKIDNLMTEKVQKIYLIGNGHFDGSREPGAHQLALFLEISTIFGAQLIFQDPVCSPAELQWLQTKNVEIRQKIDTEIDLSTGIPTILVMIHGEHELFDGILKFNQKIENLIVIGNNYGGVDWELSKLREEMPRINEFFEKSIITYFPETYEPHSSAFSSTVIMSPIDE
ncbi:hypothetical protein GCK72_015781 [Caenorhabditis remanei]|uniref:SRR1-like domain-containing protein n=1 Tax=Caenorhabditis remanei TaxID=31234 RepID=A0A6A5GXF3_CAERE|nr:hypothetical protein GCK72_015781 [Caenorhabditis remanei]KAF1759316.1 hypothetical protein GCK72_015781 [Caenorhabditis remanei]